MSNYRISQTEETRERILTGAEELFAKSGYIQTQMKDVAAYVGISRPSLYRYFQDKLELGFAVQASILTQMEPLAQSIFEELATEGLNARQQLVQGILRLLSIEETELHRCFLAEFNAYQSGPRLSEDFLSRLPEVPTKRGFSLFYRLARDGVKDGSIRNDKPPRRLARVVVYSLQFAAYNLVLRGDALFDLPERDRNNFLADLAELLEEGLKQR